MRALFFLLKRCLFPSGAGVLQLALWISVAGVALGILLLVVVLSVMSGFQHLFRENYTRISSDLVVIPRLNRKLDPQFRQTLSQVRGIEAVTPIAIGQGMAMKDRSVGGVIIEGIDVYTSAYVTPWETVWVEGPNWQLHQKNEQWIWLGRQLANKLGAKLGDTVHLLLATESRETVPFVVTAITRFGIYDHDLRHVRIGLPVLNRLFERESLEPVYKCKAQEGDLKAVGDRVREALEGMAHVKLWSDMNQNILIAVEHQKKMLFLVLEIVVALASVNVVSLLLMSSHQRRRDIAILQAMGLKLRHALLFFSLQGAIVGAAGVFVGVVLGVGGSHFIARYFPALLSESIYNVTRLPVRVAVADVALVGGAGLLICVAFSLIPAVGAAMTRPVEALRYE